MRLKCECGSENFVRRWVDVDIHTPCTIELKRKVIRMDFSKEEQSEDGDSRIEYYCDECERVVDPELTLKLVTEYWFE